MRAETRSGGWTGIENSVCKSLLTVQIRLLAKHTRQRNRTFSGRIDQIQELRLLSVGRTRGQMASKLRFLDGRPCSHYRHTCCDVEAMVEAKLKGNVEGDQSSGRSRESKSPVDLVGLVKDLADELVIEAAFET